MERNLAAAEGRYAKTRYEGISDGARDLVPWLQKHTGVLVLDFFMPRGIWQAPPRRWFPAVQGTRSGRPTG